MGRRGGFSLVEVLLAIFILGVGVIAVAALFPAGIAQQRRSVDDIIGPIVANNAMAILRTRLRPDDFGIFEEHIFGYDSYPIIHGDWTWRRPGFFFDDQGAFPDTIFAGSISIFGHSNGNVAPDAMELDSVDVSIPWNTDRYANDPVIIFNQGERYYPMQTQNQPVTPPLTPPQYVWDCMFRRYQGNILVAIFVYRVTVPGGGSSVYRVPPNGGSSPLPVALPPLPIEVVLDPADPDYNLYGDVSPFTDGMWDANTPMIVGTADPASYDAGHPFQAWQEPRQWILDQNNNVHRTLSRFVGDSGSVEVELVRPVPEALRSFYAIGVPAVQTNQFPNLSFSDLDALDTDGNGLFDKDIVSHIWYLPLEIDHPSGTFLLTPVYVTVRQL